MIYPAKLLSGAFSWSFIEGDFTCSVYEDETAYDTATGRLRLTGTHYESGAFDIHSLIGSAPGEWARVTLYGDIFTVFYNGDGGGTCLTPPPGNIGFFNGVGGLTHASGAIEAAVSGLVGGVRVGTGVTYPWSALAHEISEGAAIHGYLTRSGGTAYSGTLPAGVVADEIFATSELPSLVIEFDGIASRFVGDVGVHVQTYSETNPYPHDPTPPSDEPSEIASSTIRRGVRSGGRRVGQAS